MIIEVTAKKNLGGSTMKRNKRTEIMGHADLTPLTELILNQMGAEGSGIRQRLKNFYRIRALKDHPPFPEPLEKRE
jgi:hypothetical protein